MKRTIGIILVAVICFASCKKKDTTIQIINERYDKVIEITLVYGLIDGIVYNKVIHTELSKIESFTLSHTSDWKKYEKSISIRRLEKNEKSQIFEIDNCEIVYYSYCYGIVDDYYFNDKIIHSDTIHNLDGYFYGEKDIKEGKLNKITISNK